MPGILRVGDVAAPVMLEGVEGCDKGACTPWEDTPHVACLALSGPPFTPVERSDECVKYLRQSLRYYKTKAPCRARDDD